MRYLICKKQKGKGCDYTIGCGMVYEFVEFDGAHDDAVKHFSQLIAYPGGPEDWCALADEENPLAEAWIIPADGAVRVDIKGMLAARKKREKEEADEEKKAEELRTLAALKAKYGG